MRHRLQISHDSLRRILINIQMSNIFPAEVGVFFTILGVLTTVLLYFLASMNIIKERIDSLHDMDVQHRATDKEEIKDLISDGIYRLEKMIVQRP